jgi:bacterioferritin-associated ferredoxin
MYVCVCNAVTDSDIRIAVDSGVRNLKQLGKATGCGSSCGCCKEMAVDVLEQALTEKMEASCLFPVLQLA